MESALRLAAWLGLWFVAGPYWVPASYVALASAVGPDARLLAFVALPLAMVATGYALLVDEAATRQ